MRVMFATCLIFGLAFAAWAQDKLTAQEFDRATQGKTLIYSLNGTDYGAEEHLENRRVRWSFLDGKCKEGVWYEQAGNICFVYEDRPDPQCWSFAQGADSLIATFETDPSQMDRFEARESDEPLLCLGPEIGV